MADYNISGLTPALTGGNWSGGSSWFLLDQSGTFSVDKDLICTIYLVGGGCSGKTGTAYEKSYARGGKGGDGGCVYAAEHVAIPKDMDCSVEIAGIDNKAGTSLNISGNVLNCNHTGYSSTTGGQGGYVYYVSNRNWYKTGNKSGAGSSGVSTPYGVVGSSGGGGGADGEAYNGDAYVYESSGGTGAGIGGRPSSGSTSSAGGNATNYGCGGGGGSSYSGSYDKCWSGGSGKGGCVIICVEGGNYPLPYLETTEFDYNGKEQRADGNNLKNFDSSVMEVSGTISGTYTSKNEDGGTYKIRVSFKSNDYDFKWVGEDGNVYTPTDKDGNVVDYIELTWKINPITVPKPAFTTDSFEYEGHGYNKSITSYISGYDEYIMEKEGVETAYNAGIYPITFRLLDEESSSWVDEEGNTITGDIVVPWKITPIKVDRPYIVSNEFTYKGATYYPFNNSYDPVDNFSGYNSKVMNQEGTLTQSNAGDYSVKYTIYDADSCAWSDLDVTLDEESGTWVNNTELTETIKWKINKRVDKVAIPYLTPTGTDSEGNEITEFTYTGGTLKPTINNQNTTYATYSGTFSSVKAGTWHITAKLNTDANIIWRWDDGTEEGIDKDIDLPWKVNKAILELPTVTPERQNYDGTVKTVTATSYSASLVTRTGTLSGTAAKEYPITYTIKDKECVEWATEEDKTKDRTISWWIDPIKIKSPTSDNTSIEVSPTSTSYNSGANTQYLDYVNNSPDVALANVATITGHYGAYPDKYTATFTLKDPDSASWDDGTADGTDEPQTIEWEITKKDYLVTKPSIKQTPLPYTGLSQTVQFNDRNDGQMTIGGETAGTAARKYEATATLKESRVYDYAWADDNSTDVVELEWEIERTAFKKPTLTDYSFDYNGLTQSVTVNDFNSNIMEYEDGYKLSGKAAGKYPVIVRLKDKTSAYWEDGSTDDVDLSWVINHVKFDIPVISDTVKTYTGSTQSPTISGYNSNVMYRKGTYSTANAGTYEFYFELIDPYSSSWADGTTEIKRFRWTINKAEKTLDKPYLSATEFTYNGYTYVYYATNSTYSSTRGYTYAYVRDVNSTYMSVSGTMRASSAGEYEIIVTLKDTQNYNCKWSDGSTEPLKLKWKINKAVFEIPTLSSDHFYYGGRWETTSGYRYGYRYASISGFNAWVMTSNAVTGYRRSDGSWVSTQSAYYENSSFYTPSEWQIGKYYARFYLKDPASATWSDGTNGEITIEWSISREIVLLKRPKLEANSFEYDGTEKKPVITNETAGIVFTGTRQATEVGNYDITARLYREFDLDDVYDYRWDDNDTEDVIVMDWNIWSDGKIAVPNVAPKTFAYDGKTKTPAIYGFNSNIMMKSGVFSAKKKGVYEITFSLKHPDSVTWGDGTTDPVTVSWEITKSKVNKPYITPDDLMFDAYSHTVEFAEDDTGGSFVVYNYNSDIMSYSGDTKGTLVDEYEFVVSLKDPDSCTWEDGTTDDVTLPFYISKKTVLLDVPYLKENRFVYNGKLQTPEIMTWKTSGMEKSGDLSATAAGNYKITVSLIEDRNITYLWSDHTDEPIELDWEIAGRTAENGNGVEFPVVTNLEFVYDGSYHAPTISDYDKYIISMSGVGRAVNAGKYQIIFSLADKTSSTWADGTTDDYIVSWEIKKAEIDKPTSVKTSFLYNGKAQNPIYDGLDMSAVIKSVDIDKVSAGNYTQTITPDSNHIWSDGTTDGYSVDWEITKTSFKKPTITKDTFDFNGNYQTPEFDDNYNTNVMIKTGDFMETPAGNYTMQITLKDTNSCEWEDGTTEPLTFNWVINKAYFKKPTMTKGVFDFNGSSQTPEFDGFDQYAMVKTGDYIKTAANNYTMQITLKDTNSCEWEDGTTEPLTFNWVINHITVDIPDVTDLEYIYDGEPHKPTITGLDLSVMIISGEAEQTNAGDYTVTISLKDPDSSDWSDGTTTPKTTAWIIKKMEHEKPTLDPNAKEFNYGGGVNIPKVVGIDEKYMTVSGDLSAIDAGIYHVIVSFKEPNNHKWVDGDSSSLSLEWIIHGKLVGKPYLEKDSFVYNGKTKEPIILGFKTASMKKGGNLKETDVGDYNVVITLRPNYEWAGGGFDPLELPWEITKIKVAKPVVTDTEFVYDKLPHEPKVSGLDADKISDRGTFRATNAGDYSITYELADKEHIEWDDGSGSEDYVVPWYIRKQPIKKPVGEVVYFVYNGGVHKPTIENFEHYAYYAWRYVNGDYGYYLTVSDDDVIIATGTYDGAVDAGTYTVTCEILYKNNYIWDDGTSDNMTIYWHIGKKPIPKPYLVPSVHEYDGSVKTVTISGFISDAMCYPMENDYDPYPNDPIFSATNVGVYPVTIGLWEYRFTESGSRYRVYNYCWDDGGTSNPISLKWRINPGELEYPSLITDEYTYTGSSITPQKRGYKPEIMNIIGDASAVNAGNYSIGFTIKDPVNYKWKDGVADGTLIPWKINRAKLSKTKLPYLKENLIYNGREQTPVWLDYDIRKLTIGGVNSATNVGTYTATFTPTANYIWDDGTLDAMPLSWKIEKLGIMTPKQSNTLYYNGETQTPNWTTTLNLKNITYTGETSGVEADEYYVSCECDDNCYFLDTGTTHCNAYWEILKCRLQAPYPEKKYTYSGAEITPVFLRYYPDIMQISGKTKAVEVGKYTAYFKLTDTDNYVWASSVYVTVDDLVPVVWYIVDAASASVSKIPIPYQSNYLVYNGEKQSPIFANYSADVMTLIGGIPSKTSADTYYVTFRLKDGYTWSDDTTGDKVVPWVINPKKVPFPYILTAESDGTGMYYYELEGKRYPVWRNYDPEIMRMSGDTYDVDYSWHTTYFELKDKKNYIWIRNNDAYPTYPVTWKLTIAYPRTPTTGTKKVHIPKQANRPIEDGTTKYPKWDSYDNTAIVNLGGEWEGITAGTRYVILELQPGYIWEDDTDEIKAVPWKIYETGTSDDDFELIPIHIPEQINPPYYDGLVKYPEWDLWADYGFDIVEGVLMEVPAGVYYIKLRLKTGYIWEDGTTEDKIVPWVINPRDDDVDPPPPNPIEPDPEKENPDPTVDGTPGNGGGNGCCCCCCKPTCCPDTGLFDKLNNAEFDDGTVCNCTDNSGI